jgi:hypothetical protein
VVSTLTSDAADAIVDAVLAWPGAAGGASVIIDAIDGAVGDVDPAGSAFPWRRQSAVLQWYVDMPSPRVPSVASEWIRSAHQLVGRHDGLRTRLLSLSAGEQRLPALRPRADLRAVRR